MVRENVTGSDRAHDKIKYTNTEMYDVFKRDFHKFVQ